MAHPSSKALISYKSTESVIEESLRRFHVEDRKVIIISKEVLQFFRTTFSREFFEVGEKSRALIRYYYRESNLAEAFLNMVVGDIEIDGFMITEATIRDIFVRVFPK